MFTRRLMPFVLLLPSVLPWGGGCAIIATPVYNGEGAKNPTQGRDFCAELELDARQIGVANTTAGWLAGLFGAGAMVAGSVIGAHQANRSDETLGLVATSLNLGGPLLGMVAYAFLARADAAAALGEAANRALAEGEDEKKKSTTKDADAYHSCAAAKAAWVGSRADANAVWRETMKSKDQ